MKFSFYLILFLAFTFSSCKINQLQNGLKQGKWITYDTINNEAYKYIEKYNKGEEIKTWKTFKNKKLFKKVINLKDKCLIRYYNKNRVVIESGQTMYEINEKESHWFYYGEWKIFNEKGKLIKLKYYEGGFLMSEIEIK